jgi:hypothetical protein
MGKDEPAELAPPSEEKSSEANPIDDLFIKWKEILEEDSSSLDGAPLKPDSIEEPLHSIKPELIHIRLIRLLDQRNNQRKDVFKLAKRYCWVSLAFLIVMISVQIIGRILQTNHHFDIFSGSELKFYITGVFGQFVGLLYIITKALYNEEPYKDLYKRTLDM